jgi:hypothetical protein
MLEERLVFHGPFITPAAAIGSAPAIVFAMVLAINSGNGFCTCLIGCGRGKLSPFLVRLTPSAASSSGAVLIRGRIAGVKAVNVNHNS